MKRYLGLLLMLLIAVTVSGCGSKYARPDRCVCDGIILPVKEEPAPEPVNEEVEEDLTGTKPEESEMSDELAAALSDGAAPVKETLEGIKPNTDDEMSPEMAAALSDGAAIKQAIAQQGDSDEIKIDFEKIAKKGLFDVNSAKISKDSYEGLNTVAEYMEENPSIKLRVEGHTDSTGNKDYNQKLSERRAASVKNYLVEKGVDASRITTKGFGASKPIATNATKEGRAQNRRTELVFKTK